MYAYNDVFLLFTGLLPDAAALRTGAPKRNEKESKKSRNYNI